jgi:hypothetical protein
MSGMARAAVALRITCSHAQTRSNGLFGSPVRTRPVTHSGIPAEEASPRLQRRDVAWWIVSGIFVAVVAVAFRVFYLLGKAAGRKEILDWLAKNPAGGYQLLERRRKHRRRNRDMDPPLEE